MADASLEMTKLLLRMTVWVDPRLRGDDGEERGDDTRQVRVTSAYRSLHATAVSV